MISPYSVMLKSLSQVIAITLLAGISLSPRSWGNNIDRANKSLKEIKISLAGHDHGNGGDAIWIKGKLYSLDLVEAGVEKSPFFDDDLAVEGEILNRLHYKLDPNHFPIYLLALKLSEIYRHDKVRAILMLKAIEMYWWKVVNYPLVDVRDEQTLLKLKRKNLVQIAIRKNQAITIDGTLRPNMDDKNFVAVILHEVNSALQPPESKAVPSDDKESGLASFFSPHPMYQSSAKVVERTGYYFTREFALNGVKPEFLFKGEGLISESKDTSKVAFGPLMYFYIENDNLDSAGVINTDQLPALTSDMSGDQIRQHVTSVCNQAISHKLPLLLAYQESWTGLSFDTYFTFKGWERTYLRIISPLRIDFQSMPIFWNDLNSCINEASAALIHRLVYINTNFR